MHELEVRRPADLAHREEWPELFQWLSGNLQTFRSSLAEFVGLSTPSEHMGPWDEQSFFEGLAANCPRAVGPARRILEWGKGAMPTTYWGHGRSEGSCVPVLMRRGVEYSVVSLYTTGVFCVRFGALKKLPPFEDEQSRLELLARLNNAPHVDLPPTVIERYPGLPLALLAESDAVMTSVLSAMDWVVKSVKVA